ncbi:MAG: CRTAC1 family protein [Bryobacterales bacterium]|nr:CRTAC1 family protein [Bryobacterales bacterium]
MALAAASLWTTLTLPVTLETGELPDRKPLPATMPGGIAVFDFDDDGVLDLFFSNGGQLPDGKKAKNRMLRGLGDFRFVDVTDKAGVGGAGYDFGAAVADYDGDGRLDLFVAGLRGVVLYRNLGNGGFGDVTAKAGIDNRGRWAVGGAWFDMENDGDADLLVLNYVRWDPATEKRCVVEGKLDFCHPKFYDPQPNALFRNNGDGTFTDVSEASGIGKHEGKGMGVAAADFDGDGLTDIFVTNDRLFAFYFHNLGQGRFAEKAFDAGVAVPQDGNPVSAMGAEAQDYDNDGRPDLAYTALRDETFPLYRNRGGEFVEVTAASRMAVLSRPMAGWGIAFADLDNDGWKDIAVARSDALSAQGARGESAKEPPAWFRNLGDGKFAKGTGFESLPPAMYRGLVAADLNNDGCLDLVLTARDAAACVLRHPCAAPRNWLKVDVPVLGARVRVEQQWRHVTTAAGYASSYAGPLHFGLGALMKVTGEVLFPDGKRKTFESPANRTIRVEP